jgi:hypothetical protein
MQLADEVLAIQILTVRAVSLDLHMRNPTSADHGKKRPERPRGNPLSFSNRMTASSKEANGGSTTDSVTASTRSGQLSPTGYASQGSSRGEAEVPLYLESPTISRSEQPHQSLLTTDSAFSLQKSRGGSSLNSDHTTIEEELQVSAKPSRPAPEHRYTMSDPDPQEDLVTRAPEGTDEQTKILRTRRSGRTDWLKEMSSWSKLRGKGQGKRSKEALPKESFSTE